MINVSFMSPNSLQPGVGFGSGVGTAKGTGANGFGGDAGFAAALVHALLGQQAAGSSELTGMLPAGLFAKVMSAEAGDRDSQLGELLAGLIGRTDAGLQTDANGSNRSELTGAMLIGMLEKLLQGDSASGDPKPGDLLASWLDGLQDGQSGDKEDVLNDMMALSDLAQAIVTQWQPVEPRSDDQAEQASISIETIEPDAARTERTADLLQTLRQLAELAKTNPDEPELIGLVKTFEQMIQTDVLERNVSSASGTAQLQAAVQANADPLAAGHTNGAAVIPFPTPAKPKQAESGMPHKTAVVPQTLLRAADLKERLEALAAKASLLPHIATVQSGGERESVEALQAEAAETNADGADGMPLQAHHAARHVTAATAQTQPQPQTHVVHADRFADEMAQALKSLKVSAAGGLSEVRITLMPEHLGHVDVKVTMHNGQVVAQFAADSAHGKEMLEGQLSQLRAMLQTQGLQVDRLEVTLYDPQQNGAFQDAGEQRQSQSDRRGKQESADGGESAGDFLKQLESAAGIGPKAADGFDVTA
ncbi:flagellar hook-length control protein FliK [Paenibacillus sp. GYB003]|uniref:flagellar hook-length control protein FliK n=1 Tax=Paenibacillus sp. GYB003 TaxID=2994392 RepID=UPI002F96247B